MAHNAIDPTLELEEMLQDANDKRDKHPEVSNQNMHLVGLHIRTALHYLNEFRNDPRRANGNAENHS